MVAKTAMAARPHECPNMKGRTPAQDFRKGLPKNLIRGTRKATSPTIPSRGNCQVITFTVQLLLYSLRFPIEATMLIFAFTTQVRKWNEPWYRGLVLAVGRVFFARYLLSESCRGLEKQYQQNAAQTRPVPELS